MAASGKVVETIFPVLIGPGGDNGKTTMIEAVSFALGALAGQVPSDMLVAGSKASTSGIDPPPWRSKAVRLVYASETEDNAKVFLESGADLAGKVPVEILSD
jgi:hypothetical protein